MSLLRTLADLIGRIGPGWSAAIILGLVVVVLVVQLRRARGRMGRENARRGRLARDAEEGAARLLARAGYRVLDVQVAGSMTVRVDGRDEDARLRADLVVERRGRRYVAEVKSTAEAARPTLPATRRQLLEYLLAFDVDGVLLVDMSAMQVLEIEFPILDG